MAVLFAAVIAQVFARYVLNFSFAWSEELPTLLFGWLVFLGAAAGFAEGRHLGITFTQDWLPSRLRQSLRVGIHLVIFAFLVFCIVTGWKLASIFGHYDFVVLPISRYWLFAAVPLGALLAVPVVTRNLIGELRGKPATLPGPADEQGQLS